MQRSDLYRQALDASTRHHARSKTYSGSFARHHAGQIRDVIRAYGCKTLLDWGCGKGQQYHWRVPPGPPHYGEDQLLADYWGVRAWLYDPAVPEFQKPPARRSDIVICTHVLSTIPTQDIPSVIAELHMLADRVIFVAERLEEPKSSGAGKGPIAELGREHFPVEWEAARWMGALRGPRPVVGAFRIPGREGYLILKEDGT